jgi:hypothetical protein
MTSCGRSFVKCGCHQCTGWCRQSLPKSVGTLLKSFVVKKESSFGSSLDKSLDHLEVRWRSTGNEGCKAKFTLTLKSITEMGVPVANLLKVATCDCDAYLIIAHYWSGWQHCTDLHLFHWCTLLTVIVTFHYLNNTHFYIWCHCWAFPLTAVVVVGFCCVLLLLYRDSLNFLNWIVLIGRFDRNRAVPVPMNLGSSFWITPYIRNLAWTRCWP